jgi:hypothetical protein
VFSRVLFFTLTLDSIIESKCKFKSDKETNKSCKVTELDEKIKMADTLRGGMEAAVGLSL